MFCGPAGELMSPSEEVALTNYSAVAGMTCSYVKLEMTCCMAAEETTISLVEVGSIRVLVGKVLTPVLVLKSKCPAIKAV